MCLRLFIILFPLEVVPFSFPRIIVFLDNIKSYKSGLVASAEIIILSSINLVVVPESMVDFAVKSFSI